MIQTFRLQYSLILFVDVQFPGGQDPKYAESD